MAWSRLPEPKAIARLEAVAAKAYGAADGSMAVAVPGTQLLISLLPRLFPHDSVAILGPIYGEYARSFASAGSRVMESSTLDALADAPGAVICNPNNPDGRRFDAGALLELVRKRAGKGLLLVDESFADLEGEGLSLVPPLPQAGVLVLRSLSGLGVSGSRFGRLPDCRIDPRPRSGLGRYPGRPSRSGRARFPIAPGLKRQSSSSHRM
ncbi:MAG TPA: aminotransferase class I/II-fold pyridoxal phosphate-dependent enzyme [Methyloceanibacter sp.]|nr:aminotransferase class I/II-fold pyridoxal phosphate-dependent enzyme [Methyloceanibacter sp.]